MNPASQNVAKLAFRFVLIIGIVNFFAEMTYEGARAVTLFSSKLIGGFLHRKHPLIHHL